MRTHNRLRHAAIRIGFVASLAITLAWLMSTILICDASTREVPLKPGAGVQLNNGAFVVMAWTWLPSDDMQHPGHIRFEWREFAPALRLPAIYSLRPTLVAVLPLWLPFLACALPTAYLFHRDRRRPIPNHCKHCNYNLTGNQSGTCPECGLACTSASDHTA